MSYGDLPTTGLYIVLSVVVVWSAMLTAQIADIRKRGYDGWWRDARRLKISATWLLRIAKWGGGQVAIVLLFAAWDSLQHPPEGKGIVQTWWSPVHILAHLMVLVALFISSWPSGSDPWSANRQARTEPRFWPLAAATESTSSPPP